jgi:hypothetical protein
MELELPPWDAEKTGLLLIPAQEPIKAALQRHRPMEQAEQRDTVDSRGGQIVEVH